MNASTPPRLATALLERLGPRDEALIGDLVEEYRSGRSSAWYWGQVLTAIVIGTASEVRAHKLVAVRVFAIGWIVGWVYSRYVSPWIFSAVYTALQFDQFLFTTGLVKWFYLYGLGFPGIFLDFAWPLTIAVGWFANGWLVGRLHRGYGPSMVLAYFACVTIVFVLQVTWAAATSSIQAIPEILAYESTAFMVGCVPVLLGGLWGAGCHKLPAGTRTG
jgi:hypothetical protein